MFWLTESLNNFPITLENKEERATGSEDGASIFQIGQRRGNELRKIYIFGVGEFCF